MGMSGSKTTQKVNQTQTGSVTPTNPQWTTDAIQGMVNRIGQFGQTDPQSYVAQTNPLLQQAFANAGSLSGSGWDGQGVMSLLQQIAGAGPNLAGPGQGYQAPQLGQAQSYQAPQLGQALLAAIQGYDPAQVGQVQVGDVPQAQAYDATAQSLLDNLGSYMSPYTSDVVNTTLAGFDDQAGRVQAAQQALGARNNAFGGSRYAIQQAQTQADMARERAGIEAGLRNQAFNTGAGLSADDANRRQQVSVGNADRQTGVSTFNAGQALQRALSQAGLDMQGNLYNADSWNAARAFEAAAGNQAALQQAQNQTQRDITGAGLAADAARHGADATNQFRAIQAGYDADAARYGADVANRFSEFNAGQRDNALGRQLQAAGQMGQTGAQLSADQRANLGLQGQLGTLAQGLDQARAQAPIDQMDILSRLYGNLPFDLFTGQNSTGTLTGSTVTKQSGGLGQALMGIAGLGLAATGAGGPLAGLLAGAGGK